MTAAPKTLYQSNIHSLPLIHRGKVRDIYAVGDKHMLIVTTDRLSAFDVILPDAIPGKGAVLTALSNFWFERLGGIVPNQGADLKLEDVLPKPEERADLAGRTMIVRKLKALPVEAVVRGYLIGSGWKSYQATGAVSGVALPEGLRMGSKIAQPIFTPTTKAPLGEHDESIDFEQTRKLLGDTIAEQVRDTSVRLYTEAAAYALERGIIIADTKFEFGVDDHGTLTLIDELLTPDSSRFWPADQYRPGVQPPSFDKQFLRDYLETLDWDKKPPAPKLPQEIIDKTAAKYQEALRRLTER